MTSRYVLDADVIIHLEKGGGFDAIQALGRLPVVVTDPVWDELTPTNMPQSQVSRRAAFLSAIAGAPTLLLPQSAQAATLAELLRPPRKEGDGELSIIAYAIHATDDIAVLIDRTAVHRAVEELRARVLSLHGFLGVLRDSHGLSASDAAQISTAYCKAHTPVRPPLWF